MENICPNIKECPFFIDQMKKQPSLTKIVQKIYCYGNYVECARQIVLTNLGAEFVDLDLFPQQKDKALNLIKEKGK